jgi:hypothetical protein
MGSASLTGNDTIIIDTRIMRDFADGDTVTLEFPNNLSENRAGKNGNMIIAYNAAGKQVNATLRILRGSGDDKYLNARMQEYINDPAGFILLEAEFVKRTGDGQGNIAAEVYKLEGGTIQKIPGTKENVAGDTEQAVSVYVITFANNQRSIG